MDEQGRATEPREPAETVAPMVARTTRFSREVVATMISLASAAFGVVAALAWNGAITAVFARYFGEGARIGALFAYAVLVTVIGVVIIVLLGRLAARINAQPVEFKYPGVPKTDPGTG
jgi:uncharacterized membrane protein YjjP (DUF1212 family)